MMTLLEKNMRAWRRRDTFPHIRAAGKVIPPGDRAQTCLQETTPRTATPPVVRKFLNSSRPEAGAIRAFFGKATDPDIASALVHGISTRPTVASGSLINPPPKTRYQERLCELQEAGYNSKRKAPLGGSQVKGPGLPDWVDPERTAFGVKSLLPSNAGEVINPPKTAEEVEREAQEGHKQYVRSHSSYFVGERVDRRYDQSTYSKESMFGMSTPHRNDGHNASRCLQWLGDVQARYRSIQARTNRLMNSFYPQAIGFLNKLKHSAKFVSKRCDDFRERTQPQIGKVLHPMAQTLGLSADHTFGVLLRPDKFGNVNVIGLSMRDVCSQGTSVHNFQMAVISMQCLDTAVLPPPMALIGAPGRGRLPIDPLGAGDLIHFTPPSEHTRGQDRRRTLVSAVRQHLKKANFHNFPSLLQAFRHYDKKGQGKIDKEDLRDVCRQFNLDLSGDVLDGLMDYCDVDKDGLISFLEFANFLNWKDKMPISMAEQRLLTRDRNVSSAPANMQRVELQRRDSAKQAWSESLVRAEDLEPVEVGGTLKTPRTISRSRTERDRFMTSSSLISAVVGGLPTTDYRTYGVPSVRTDLPAPRIKRISDCTNYGDEATAYNLLYPTLHSLCGVHEKHFFSPRSKEEVALIFRNVGLGLSEEMFEEAWKLASLRHPSGEVCVESFRNVLQELQAN